MSILQLLDRPSIYRLAQWLLAPGSEAAVARKLARVRDEIRAGGAVLDVGCGPASWLFKLDLNPIGVDLTPSYVARYVTRPGAIGVVGSADALPFENQSFDSVWTFGLLHHLPDEVATRTVREMVRVCKSGGHVVVFDNVMPRVAAVRPLAYLIRVTDRGRFVRTEASLRQLLTRGGIAGDQGTRFTYTYNGLEGLLTSCQIRHPGASG